MMARLTEPFQRSFDDAKVGKVSISLVVGEPVAHHDDIRNLEAAEV